MSNRRNRTHKFDIIQIRSVFTALEEIVLQQLLEQTKQTFSKRGEQVLGLNIQ